MIKIKTNHQLHVARVGVRVSGVGAEPIPSPPHLFVHVAVNFIV